MITQGIRFLHPLDTQAVLSGTVFLPPIATTGGAAGLPCLPVNPVGELRGQVSSGYVRTVCHKCQQFAPLGGPQIDGYIVCETCAQENAVMDNTLPCPYKDPKRRKYKITTKPNGLQWSWTTTTTKANT